MTVTGFTPPSLRTRLLWAAVVGLVVFAFTRILIPMVMHPEGAVSLWVPSGIAAAGIIAVGPIALPFVFAGLFLASIMAVPFGMAAGMSLIGMMGPLVFWLILRKSFPNGFELTTVRDAVRFGLVGIAAGFAPAILGTVVLLGMQLIGGPFAEGVLTWWLADSSAVLAIAPIALLRPRGDEPSRRAHWDGVVVVALSVVASWYAYTTALPIPVERAIPIMLLPFFVWIAYHGSVRLVGFTVAVHAVIATIGTLRGFGPFSSDTLHESLIALNLVIAIFGLSSLIMALLFEERARLAALAEVARANLEERVEQRTAELSAANESLRAEMIERRRTEEELAERELSFRLLYERAPLAYQSLDANGCFLDVNDAWLDLFGYESDEILGTWFGDVIQPSQAVLFAERFVGFKVSGSVNGAQFDVQCKDGSSRQVAVYGRIAHTEDGSVLRTHCILQDVTRQNAEVAALRASREHFASMFENNHTIMVLVDPATARFVDVNAAACEFFGYSHDEFLEKTVMDLTDIDADAMLSRLSQTASGLGGGVRQDRQRLASGEMRDMEIHSGPIDVNGVRLVFATMQDVTDRIAAEREVAMHRERLSELVSERTRELELAYAELEAASAAKDQFLANMSHELRTPLNSIIGFSDMLLSGLVGTMDVEQERQIGMINTSGKQLLELVNDVLDLSRIEAGQIRAETEEFELTPLLESVVESLRPAALGKGLELRVEVEDGPCVIATDRRKVRQILLNLVGNAVKFTDTGEVVLRAECTSRDTVAFSVSDTGLGIVPSELGRIFDQFVQIAPPDEAKPSGTGLGLAISLRLARILGGDLTVTSSVGEGSVFTLTLPAVVHREPVATR